MTGLITATPGIDILSYGLDNYGLYRSPLAAPQRPEYLVAPLSDYDSYQTDWPSYGGMLGGFSPMGLSGILPAISYDPFIQAANWTGHLGWKTFSGITRDTNSAVLPSVTVQLFRTSDDLRMDERVSDPSTGAYSAYSSDTGNHYIVAYLAGSPDRAGTTVNTLTGV